MDRVDDHLNYFLWVDAGLDTPDPKRQKFKFGFITHEEWEDYKHKEMLWTAPQLKKFWAAHSKVDRDEMRRKLYDARKQFYEMWFNRSMLPPNPGEKLLA